MKKSINFSHNRDVEPKISIRMEEDLLLAMRRCIAKGQLEGKNDAPKSVAEFMRRAAYKYLEEVQA
jgi:hypothetical protein